jgi:hypothetical protein
MNPLYQQMNRNNPMTMVNQIKNNPAQFLSQRGVNIPQNMNNPNDILNHLMSTGKVSQGRYNQAVNMAQMLMGKR